VVIISSISFDCEYAFNEKIKIKHKDNIFLYLYMEFPLNN
jgi:hypothetical protein